MGAPQPSAKHIVIGSVFSPCRYEYICLLASNKSNEQQTHVVMTLFVLCAAMTLFISHLQLFHPTVPPDNDWPKSWSTTANLTHGATVYYSPECMPPRCNHSVPFGNNTQKKPNGHFECVSRDPGKHYTSCPTNTSATESRYEYQLEDQRIRDSCIAQLDAAASSSVATKAGFFIGCGFHKPHVPWEFPAEFLDHFPQDLEDIPLANDTYAPVDMPDAAWHYPADVHGFDIDFNGTCNETRSRDFRRSYYAAIAYTDYNIGRLLQRLDGHGLTETTAVVVFGDHGSLCVGARVVGLGIVTRGSLLSFAALCTCTRPHV